MGKSGADMTDTIMTIRASVRAEQTVEKSRFICTMSRVSSREAAGAFFSDIRREFRDASHNVPVMLIGPEGSLRWSSEDGEPSGTAGAPVLRMLEMRGLTDIAAVITRYFGGIRLGTGGLLRAYTGTAALALEKAEICELRRYLCMPVKMDHQSYWRLNPLRLPCGAFVRNAAFAGQVEFTIAFPPGNEGLIRSLLLDASGGCAVLGAAEEEFLDISCRPS